MSSTVIVPPPPTFAIHFSHINVTAGWNSVRWLGSWDQQASPSDTYNFRKFPFTCRCIGLVAGCYVNSANSGDWVQATVHNNGHGNEIYQSRIFMGSVGFRQTTRYFKEGDEFGTWNSGDSDPSVATIDEGDGVMLELNRNGSTATAKDFNGYAIFERL